MVFLTRTGISWRDSSERFGNWTIVYNRFSGWANRRERKDISDAILVSKSDQSSMMDSSVVRAHQDAFGAKRGPKENCIGGSLKGFSIKIYMLADALGMP